MPLGLSLAPLTLAAVLVVSGVAKLRDPGATTEMVEALRLPASLRHRAVAAALPGVELVTAALLLAPWTAVYAVGAVLAVGLFTAFLLVVAHAMRLRPRPVCGCFGRVGDHGITGRTLGRNVLLLAVALVAAWLAVAGAPGMELVGRYGAEDWVWLTAATALAVVSVLVLARAHPAPDEPSAGDTPGAQEAGGAPAGPGSIPRGVLLSRDLDVVPLRRLVRQQSQLLVLVNCWCGTTFEVVERLPGWRARLAGAGVQVQLVHTYRPWEETGLDGLDGVWWDPGGTVYDALAGGRSPAAVVLGTDGTVTSGPVRGLEAVEELLTRVARTVPEARTSRPPG